MEILLGLAIVGIVIAFTAHITTTSKERILLSKLIKVKDVSEFEYMLEVEKPEKEEEEKDDNLVELEGMPDLYEDKK